MSIQRMLTGLYGSHTGKTLVWHLESVISLLEKYFESCKKGYLMTCVMLSQFITV